MGNTASSLLKMGEDVRVLTVADPPLMNDLVVDFPENRVHRTKWHNLNRIPDLFSGGSERVRSSGYGDEAGARGLAATFWRTFVHIPDQAGGWIRPGIRAGTILSRNWRPDVILASSGPPSGLIIASEISRRTGIPWVADYRDTWSGNLNSTAPALRQRLDQSIERHTIRNASAVVTVNEDIAEFLKQMHGKPTRVVLNGFDPADLCDIRPSAGSNEGPLVLRHMGTIYEGLRDPSPLFEALRDNPGVAEAVRVEFFGRNLANLQALIDRYEVGHCVARRDAVTRAQALQLEADSDVLLLLTHPDEIDKGTLPGKFFEYVGIGRPILQIGYSQSVCSELIRTEGFGEVASTAREVVVALSNLLARKRGPQGLSSVPQAQRTPFSRTGQVQALREVLHKVAAPSPAADRQ